MSERFIQGAALRPRGPFITQLQPVTGAEYYSVRDGTFGRVPLINDYLRDLRRDEGRSIHTSQGYARDLKIFLEWCENGEPEPMTVLEGLDKLGRFKTFLQQDGIRVAHRRKGSPRAPATRQRILTSVRGMASYGIDRGYLPNSLEPKIWRPTEGRSSNLQIGYRGRSAGTARHKEHVPRQAEAKAARPDEYERLLEACRNERDFFFILLVANTGLRLGEATGLRLSDMHLLMNSARMTKLADVSGYPCDGRDGPHVHVVDRRGKPDSPTAKGKDYGLPTHRRILPVNSVVEDAYALYLTARNSISACKKSDFVFVNIAHEPVGSPFTPSGAYNQLRAISGRARLDRSINPHMLRHMYGMALGASGVDRAVIADLLGHQHVSSTSAYVRPTTEQLRAATEAASGYLADQLNWHA